MTESVGLSCGPPSPTLSPRNHCISMCNWRERGTGRGGWRCHWGTPLASVLSLLLAINTLAEAESPVVLEVGKFSAAAEGPGLPDGWKPLTFKKIERHTTYTLVKDEEAIVIKALSEASSSGLTKEIKINPKEYPIVEWRWKVSNIYKNGDVTRKEGDDYPARLYITFEYEAGKVGFFKKAQYEAEVKALIESGFVGQPRHALITLMNTSRTDPNRPWNWWFDVTRGGGLLGAVGSHQIDLLRYWLGEIESASGTVETCIKERPAADGTGRRRRGLRLRGGDAHACKRDHPRRHHERPASRPDRRRWYRDCRLLLMPAWRSVSSGVVCQGISPRRRSSASIACRAAKARTRSSPTLRCRLTLARHFPEHAR